RDGIRVNAICPGTIRTRLTADIVDRVERWAREGRGIPLGRVGEPEDIARCALFLASDDASFISGAAIVADGGAMAATPEGRRLIRCSPRPAGINADSPCLRLRLAGRPRDVLRLALPLGGREVGADDGPAEGRNLAVDVAPAQIHARQRRLGPVAAPIDDHG